MKRILSIGFSSLLIAMHPAQAVAATQGFNLFARVPLQCSVNHQLAGFGAAVGEGFSLGTFREYCNSPNGYELIVNYAPGTLRGTRIIAGSEQITLDGSGRALLSRTHGPRNRVRPIAAVPGMKGFDSDHLDLRIIPN